MQHLSFCSVFFLPISKKLILFCHTQVHATPVNLFSFLSSNLEEVDPVLSYTGACNTFSICSVFFPPISKKLILFCHTQVHATPFILFTFLSSNLEEVDSLLSNTGACNIFYVVQSTFNFYKVPVVLFR